VSNTQWIPAIAAVVTGLVTALAAVWTFSRQRATEQRREQELQATRLVTPFLFAAEDLQSRLYNITQLEPQSIMSADQWTSFTIETLYLLAQYFYYEPLVLQYTTYGRDLRFMHEVQYVRAAFAAAHSMEDVDPWCLFRPRQKTLGRIIAAPNSSPETPGTISLTEFEELLRGERLTPIGILSSGSLDIYGATSPQSIQRLANAQTALVDLLEYLEHDLVARQASWYRPLKRRSLANFSVFVGDRSPSRMRAIRGIDGS